MSNRDIIEDSSLCPITLAMTKIGGKWKPIIIYVLSSGKLRFGKINFFISGISRKVLTQQLRELEEDGILTRTVYAETPPRVEYELTEMGMELLPIYQKMAEWSFKHLCEDA